MSKPSHDLPADPRQERLVALLQLKRHETPGEDYHASFLARFHARQREAMLKGSSLKLFSERMGVFFDQLAGGRWMAGGLAGYAAMLLGAMALLHWSAQPDQEAASHVLEPTSLQWQAQPQGVPVQLRVVPVKPLPVAKEAKDEQEGQ